MTDLLGLTMSYDALVEAGREARLHTDDYQWTEGDLALEVEHLTGDDRPRDEAGKFLAGEAALKRYADDIEIAYSTLSDYRRVAEAWPTSRRQRMASWTVHAELAPVTDRFDHIRDDMTSREARELSRKLRGLDAPATQHVPGWFELLGQVGDDLAAMQKHLNRVEDIIDRRPNADLRAKAVKYAEWADDIAERLRLIGG